MNRPLDHLVIGAATLEQGAAWCEASFGVAPGPGGKHALMGTHNRLLALSSPDFPRSYLEIIAIDPEAPAPARRRWFDLDDAALQAALARGPRLIHWVARCDDLAAECAASAAAGLDRGEILAAERATPHGLLRWRIAVRADGRRPAGGTQPTLIEWGDMHPADHLPPSPLRLAAFDAAAVVAQIDSPHGRIHLEGLLA
ncbi:VOC family protein [Piscinibacter sp.]|uniref:VOC family protein n=1 Tax=Piscinibacter sp. TaxID=1903157 RepID=UPI0039E6F0B2